MSDEPLATSALERAIISQPDELERLLATPLPHDSVERLKQAHRIWLVGTVTSQHAAELGATMLHDAGRAAHAERRTISGNVLMPFLTRDAEGFDVNKPFDWGLAEHMVKTHIAKLPEVLQPPYRF